MKTNTNNLVAICFLNRNQVTTRDFSVPYVLLITMSSKAKAKFQNTYERENTSGEKTFCFCLIFIQILCNIFVNVQFMLQRSFNIYFSIFFFFQKSIFNCFSQAYVKFSLIRLSHFWAISKKILLSGDMVSNFKINLTSEIPKLERV